MDLYEVTLLVAGLDDRDDAVMDRLHASIEDVSVSDRGDLTEVTVWLEAPTGDEAVRDAHVQIESAVTVCTVRQVDLDVVAASDIAERIGQSKEAVRLWSTGARGPGHFPAPLGIVGGANATPVWAWADVYGWLTGAKPELVADMPRPVPTAVATMVNAQLMSTQLTGVELLEQRQAATEVALAAEKPGSYTPATG
jgi:hypothetical protein